MKIFVSHAAKAVPQAVRFKALMRSGIPDAQVFLSSDWDSIESGDNWLEAIECALRECDCFIALITKVEDAKRLWVNYETGFARGRGLKPKLLVFHAVDTAQFSFPLSGIHFLMHGDSNRWQLEFERLGMKMTAELHKELGALFENR